MPITARHSLADMVVIHTHQLLEAMKMKHYIRYSVRLWRQGRLEEVTRTVCNQPSTSSIVEPDFRPSTLPSSTKLSIFLPFSRILRQVRCRHSGASSENWSRSCTISRGDIYRDPGIDRLHLPLVNTYHYLLGL